MKDRKFHITITDNETGETVHESDASAVLAGIEVEGGAHGVILTHCSDIALAKAYNAVKSTLDTIDKNHGNQIRLLAELIALKSTKEEIDRKTTAETDN